MLLTDGLKIGQIKSPPPTYKGDKVHIISVVTYSIVKLLVFLLVGGGLNLSDFEPIREKHL